MSKKGKVILSTIILVMIAAVAIILITTTLHGGAKEIDRTKFREYVENSQYVDRDGKLKEGQEMPEGYHSDENGIVVDEHGDRLIVIWKVATDAYQYNGYVLQGNGDSVREVRRFICYGPSIYGADSWDSETIRGWELNGVVIEQSNPNAGNWVSTMFTVLSLVIVCVVFFLIIRSSMGGGGKMMSFAKTKARVTTNIKVRFSDVAGAEEEKVELAEVVEFLRQPKKFSDLGARIPKGVLLVGPPGTGKTLFAKAVAGEAGVPFFSVSGSDFVEMYVGVGASRVRDLFDMAKKNQPCIIFIDEIDAVGRARGRNAGMGANDERENTLNQLLTEMDGFGTNSGVIILAATNRADILDKALMRAGRFDRQIYVDLPDLPDRVEIFKVHLRKIKTAPDLDIELLARQTPGFSGADIANVCNEAALIAARSDKQSVTKEDFNAAVDRIIGGLEKRSKILTDDEKNSIAVHEAGHATVSWHLRYGNPLVKVTIVPRGKALGAAWYLPEERQIVPSQVLLDDICSLLGGRAAEEVFLGRISTGAANDLERVTKQAYAMVVYYGMSDKLPNISYYDSTGQSSMFTNPYSDDRAKIIDSEVSRIIFEQYERAKAILREHADGHHELAQTLITREVIFTEDVERIFGPRQWTSRTDELFGHKDITPKDSYTGPLPPPIDDVDATEVDKKDDNSDKSEPEPQS